MSGFLERLGGWEGVRLRLRLTFAYSVTSLVTTTLIYFVLDQTMLSLNAAEKLALGRVLVVVLIMDLVAQTYIDERILGPLNRFFAGKASAERDAEAWHAATIAFLTLPRKMALSSLGLWLFSIFAIAAGLYWLTGLAPLQVLFMLATAGLGALAVFVFQFALFRVITASFARHLAHNPRHDLTALRSAGFHLSARARLMGTFLCLVFTALGFAGLMGYGQFVRIAAEQAGSVAAASLANLATGLAGAGEDRSQWATILAEHARETPELMMAILERRSGNLVGSLPVPVDMLKEHFGPASGEFEHRGSMSRVTYLQVPDATLIAVAVPNQYLKGGLDIVWFTLVILVVTFSVALAVFNLVTRDIVAPFTILRQFAKDLAVGHVRRSPIVITEDELGRLDGALRLMESGVRSLFEGLRASLNHVKQVRHEIAGNLRDVQAHAAEQDRTVDRSFLSFNEVNQALRDSTENVDVIEKAAAESQAAIHHMESYLHDIRREFAGLIDAVRSSTRLIGGVIAGAVTSSEQVQQLFASLSKLSSQVNGIKTAFGELAGLVKQVVESASRAAELANIAIEQTGRTAQGVTTVQADTARLLTELGGFREGVRQIGEVIEIISEVTEQTALLAFNAAILAAQSHDDHAKDFGVVGDEIKDLADRTESNTKDVGVLMNKVAEQTNRSLDEMREALGRIQQGHLQTELASDSVRSMQDHAVRNDRDTRAIGDGVHYQNQNIQQIARDLLDEMKRLQHLQGYVDDNRRDAAQLRQSLDQLLSTVQGLQGATSGQLEGNQQILAIVGRISEGIVTARRDLRKLASESAEVVQFMNDIRFASRRSAGQTDEMNHQLKKLDAVLKVLEEKLAAVTVH